MASSNGNKANLTPAEAGARLSFVQIFNILKKITISVGFSLAGKIGNEDKTSSARLPATCLPAYLPTFQHSYLPTCFCLSSKLIFSGTCPVGGWVAVLIGNIAISAQPELELGLSLAI